MKPNWSQAPSWANWLAMDGNGRWYWYEFEPDIAGFGWQLNNEHDRFEEAKPVLEQPGEVYWSQTIEKKSDI